MIIKVISLLFFLSGINAQIALPTFHGVHTPSTSASSLYNFTAHTFTNCGATGQDGPTLSDCKSAYDTSWENETDYYNIQTQGVQEWTVPSSGLYTIEVWGAIGGGPGGKGARMRGNFTLVKEDVFKIVVGQIGIRGGLESGSDGGGGTSGGFGGGGGTFVYSGDSLYIAAGGGGGDAQGSGQGLDATDQTSGVASTNGEAGGTDGSYGSGSYYDGASAGSGWASADPYDTYQDSNGLIPSFSRPTWLGGYSWRHSYYDHGGFGGGGCSIHPGGGGGGYSGGGAGRGRSSAGGGGGSYNSSSLNVSNEGGVWEDHGKVTITKN